MSTQESVVLELIHAALQTLNAERGAQDAISIGPRTCLFGEASALDSLALVSVIVDLETAVSERYGRPISLTDDKAMACEPVPFTDVTTLQRYIVELVAA